jgi:glycosyltransferase involved in cell wall biosynthesis
VREFLCYFYRYPERKLALVPNGWDGEPRAESGLADQPTVVCVARFRPQKGHTDLLAAFALVRSQVEDARLILVGDGKLASELRRQAEELDLSESVEFRGTADDVWSQLAEAHVFALASLYEPLGIAVLEAMAAGLPVVATAVGGIPELVEPGRTGVLVPPGSPVAMANELTKLLTDPERRSRMSSAARRAAAERSVEGMTTSYFGLYESLLPSVGRKRTFQL